MMLMPWGSRIRSWGGVGYGIGQNLVSYSFRGGVGYGARGVGYVAYSKNRPV